MVEVDAVEMIVLIHSEMWVEAREMYIKER